jgi:DNA repair protein RadC
MEKNFIQNLIEEYHDFERELAMDDDLSQCEIQEVGLYIKNKIDITKRPIINDRTMVLNVMDKVEYFQLHLDFKEMFYAIYLDTSEALLSVMKVSEGSDAETIVSTKQIIQAALLQNAAGIILVHNHPDGDIEPSKSDIKQTNNIRKCARLFDIELMDHIIINRHDDYSFEEGY